MNTASIAVLAIAVSSLAQTGGCIYVASRLSERVRVVSPAKAPAQVPDAAGSTVPLGQAARRAS